MIGKANVDKLVPFYSLGVFTGFTLAGFGMAKYHTIHKEPGWKTKWWINASRRALSLTIVLITAVVKFTEGAWLVLVLSPLLWFAADAAQQPVPRRGPSLNLVTAAQEGGWACGHYARHVVLVMVDRLDLAVVRALRYAGSLRPTELRAVHSRSTATGPTSCEATGSSAGLGDRVPLEVVECPDRRLIRAVAETALNAVVGERAEVTVLLPRRTFRRVSQRILHDRTADRIAAAMAKIPHVSATIVPFDTTLDPRTSGAGAAAGHGHRTGAAIDRVRTGPDDDEVGVAAHQARGRRGTDRLGQVEAAGHHRGPDQDRPGRHHGRQVAGGPGLRHHRWHAAAVLRPYPDSRHRAGRLVRVTGTVGEYKGHLALANPRYELLDSGTAHEPVPQPS